MSFWGTSSQVGFKKGHGTNPHSTPVQDGSACEESLKQGASGRWISEQGENAWARWHVVPAVVTAACWQQELGALLEGPDGRCTSKGELWPPSHAHVGEHEVVHKQVLHFWTFLNLM